MAFIHTALVAVMADLPTGLGDLGDLGGGERVCTVIQGYHTKQHVSTAKNILALREQ